MYIRERRERERERARERERERGREGERGRERERGRGGEREGERERERDVAYTHLRAHETGRNIVWSVQLEKNKVTRKRVNQLMIDS